MKAVIFGVEGQDGYYLSEFLRPKGIDIVGVSRSGTDGARGDISDTAFVKDIVKTHQPEYIFHFAANSTTQHSALFENHEAISTGTLNILESVKLFCPKTKIFLSGSAMQFKNEGLPIDEKTTFEAKNAYAVARIHSVYAGRYYRDVFGLRVYAGYFFNHDSPRRTDRHLNMKVVKAVKRIAQGSNEKLELGDIDVRKEFNYAGDIVTAAWMLVNQNAVFEAVIGSGKAYSVKDWVECCFKRVNKDWQDFVVLKRDFVPEYKILVSDPRLIKSMGWEIKADFYQLADMMMGPQD